MHVIADVRCTMTVFEAVLLLHGTSNRAESILRKKTGLTGGRICRHRRAPRRVLRRRGFGAARVVGDADPRH